MIEDISKFFALVSETTAQKGISSLEKEFFECNSTFNEHLQNLSVYFFLYFIFLLLILIVNLFIKHNIYFF